MLICFTTRIVLQKQHHGVFSPIKPVLYRLYIYLSPPSLAQHLVKIMAEAHRLSTAAAKGDLRETEMILESNINVNAKNEFGRTALQVRDHHKLYTYIFYLTVNAFILLFLLSFLI